MKVARDDFVNSSRHIVIVHSNFQGGRELLTFLMICGKAALILTLQTGRRFKLCVAEIGGNEISVSFNLFAHMHVPKKAYMLRISNELFRNFSLQQVAKLKNVFLAV